MKKLFATICCVVLATGLFSFTACNDENTEIQSSEQWKNSIQATLDATNLTYSYTYQNNVNNETADHNYKYNLDNGLIEMNIVDEGEQYRYFVVLDGSVIRQYSLDSEDPYWQKYEEVYQSYTEAKKEFINFNNEMIEAITMEIDDSGHELAELYDYFTYDKKTGIYSATFNYSNRYQLDSGTKKIEVKFKNNKISTFKITSTETRTISNSTIISSEISYYTYTYGNAVITLPQELLLN